VNASVSEYQGRGFKNLMVSFGCTGGQHRSVMIAHEIYKRLKKAGHTVKEGHRDIVRK
jgi:RNase adapter protein RapZ